MNVPITAPVRVIPSSTANHLGDSELDHLGHPCRMSIRHNLRWLDVPMRLVYFYCFLNTIFRSPR